MTSHQKFQYPQETDFGDHPIFVGGTLNANTLIDAYKHGYFPWYDPGTQILWWSPDPRMVLFPEKAHVSHSMRNVFNRNIFRLTQNHAFDKVIRLCAHVRRPGNAGTWIGPEIIDAYTELHNLGVVHSYETWLDGKLAGGFYGVWIGKVFFGESMFSLEPNASKYALLSACHAWQKSGKVKVIDCQISTSHLRSLGAEEISRAAFIEYLKRWAV